MLLEDPLTFSRHLLPHEIAHIKRRDLHKTMKHDQIERDCDQWAFDQLGQPS
jgi:hypothetical protein